MIHMMIGLQGSGKSYFAERHAPKNAVIVSPDRIRQEIFHVVYDPMVEEGVWSTFYRQIEDALRENKEVIIDNTNVTREGRATIFRLAKRYDVPVIGYWFQIPIEECLKRNQARERVVPEYMIYNMQRMFDEPKLEEGFKEIKTIVFERGENRLVKSSDNGVKEPSILKVSDSSKKTKSKKRKK
jgi:predicted kinase